MIALHPSQISTSQLPAPEDVPPLQNGDHLDADEFLRRYEQAPGVRKAELIQGIVLMPSPVRADHHGDPDNLIQTWLGVYAAATPGTRASSNATTILGPRDVPQPDSHLRILPEFGGQTSVTAEKYVQGAPEFAAEIAASSASIDTREKKESYRRAGVRSYLVWRTEQFALDWWELQDGEFIGLEPNADGILRSAVFPGLWLAGEALLKLDSARVLEVLQVGLASAEHAEFVEKLAAAKS